MCGIAGYINARGEDTSRRVPATLQSIGHRGPDDLGFLRFTSGAIETGRHWTPPAGEPDAVLLHRRLSILDMSECGWQPMASADGRYHIVFNGEIYNYRELREELKGLGYQFRSTSDTEVLLASYQEWGKKAFSRFIGMFAFALLDVKRSTVLLARDICGIKPLYYSVEGRCFRFGSEIKALIALGLERHRANPERLLFFLRYGMTDFGAETMFEGIQQLPPAHLIEVALGSGEVSAVERYWEPELDAPMGLSFDEAARELRELFLRSIQLHLRSDVPLGAALSGGIDSSAIITSMRYLDSDAQIHAFSFISDDAETSEEPWIDLVGSSIGAEIHKVRITSSDFLSNLDMLTRLHDEPFARTSTHAQYEVFRAAHSAKVKVILDGQGADELLAGYRIYQGARLASQIRAGEWSSAARLLRSASTLDGFSVGQSLAFAADFLIPPSLQAPMRRLIGKEPFPSWVRRGWFAARKADVRYSSYTRAQAILHQSLSRSVREGLPSLLRYEDRNSMASSVESRVPFLTSELINFVGRLPESYLISQDGTSKSVFRAAMRGIVPDAVLNRRDKMGFVTPEKRWLTELDVWVRQTLSSETAHSLPFLNLEAAKKEWHLIRTGKKPFDHRIWRWVSLIHWAQVYQIGFD